MKTESYAILTTSLLLALVLTTSTLTAQQSERTYRSQSVDQIGVGTQPASSSMLLNLITSMSVGPDGELYVLEQTPETYTHEWLPGPLPYHNLYRYDSFTRNVEQLSSHGASTPPMFLPDGTPLVSVYEFSIFPTISQFWHYYDVADSANRNHEYDIPFLPYQTSISRNSSDLVAVGAEWARQGSDVTGTLWIMSGDGSTDRKIEMGGGVTDVAVSESGRVYASQIRETDHGIFHTYILRTDDLGKTLDTMNGQFVTRNFALINEESLVAEGQIRADEWDQNPDGLYLSINGGREWKRVLATSGETGLKPLTNTLGTFAVGYGDPTDETVGYRLIHLESQGEVVAIRPVPVDQGIVRFATFGTRLYLLLENGTIRYSDDGGVTWNQPKLSFLVRHMVVLDDGRVMVSDGNWVYALSEILSVESGIPSFHADRLNLK